MGQIAGGSGDAVSETGGPFAGDPLGHARRWREAGQGVAIATVVETWGSSPCPPGSQLAVDAALERNAREPVLLDLRGLSDATDWFLIASGDSDTHARAIAENTDGPFSLQKA